MSGAGQVIILGATEITCRAVAQSVTFASTKRGNKRVIQIKGLAAVPRDTSVPNPKLCLRKLLIVLIEADETFAETFDFWHFLLRIDSEPLFS